MELHGGRIWVESQGEDAGSCFTFSVPFVEAYARQDEVSSNVHIEAGEVSLLSLAVPLEDAVRARVLVVEDNAANMKLARNLLQAGGYLVEEAYTAEEGIRPGFSRPSRPNSHGYLSTRHGRVDRYIHAEKRSDNEQNPCSCPHRPCHERRRSARLASWLRRVFDQTRRFGIVPSDIGTVHRSLHRQSCCMRPHLACRESSMPLTIVLLCAFGEHLGATTRFLGV